ncbi:MAG: hypothetical protein PHN56_01510 [Candidatus Nanoarchaeia archaeon]|nr:hypothetical protein [Candidatus Nanoarchaeia archaeon]
MKDSFQWIVLILCILIYSFFIFFIEIDIEINVASQLVIASVFFFGMFSSFFINRQNNRYTKINDIIAQRDGYYSYLYRAFSIVPRIQGEIKGIISNHYEKILKNNDWAYNEFHSSSTISSIVKSISGITKKESELISNYSFFDGIWDVICQLQLNRKMIIASYNEKLKNFHWILIIVFAGLAAVSFHFLKIDSIIVDFIKIIFAASIFLIVMLINQLNNLSIFGKDFSKKIANDVLRIINEDDLK